MLPSFATGPTGTLVSEGPDVVYSPDIPVRRALGFMKPHGFAPQASDGAYGHGGQGGSLGFADPELLLGFGYVPNPMVLGQDERGRRLIEAMYASLA